MHKKTWNTFYVGYGAYPGVWLIYLSDTPLEKTDFPLAPVTNSSV